MVKLKILALAATLIWAGCQAKPTPSPSPSLVAVQGAPIDAPPAATATPSPQDGAPTGRGLRVAPTDPAERAKLAVDAPQPAAKEGYTPLSFTELSNFVYEADMNGVLSPESSFPDEIAKLDKTKVAVSGYLMPIEFKGSKVSTLILVRNQLLCCFGEEPKLNEWVFVNVDPPVENTVDVPVTMYGTFYASPDREEGQIISLYRMQAQAMEAMQ